MDGRQAKRFLNIASGYRIASVVLVILTQKMGGYPGRLPMITNVLLAVATFILVIVYRHIFDNKSTVALAIRLELSAMLVVYVIAGGMGNAVMWYLINPMLFDMYFFYNRYKALLYSLVFAAASFIGIVFVNELPAFNAREASVLVLFVLVIFLIDLLAGYQKDLTENILMLKAARDELTNLAEANKRLIISREQKRIAEEIHDGIQQQLAGTVFMLHSIVRPGNTMSRDQILNSLKMIYRELSTASKGLKHTVYHLADLETVADWTDQLEDELIVQTAKYGIEGTFEVAGIESDILDMIYYKALLRVQRESVSNAFRHGRAGHVAVTVRQQGDLIEIQICDDGDGFDVAVERNCGLGLHNMKGIADLYNGAFYVTSKRMAGSKVSVSILKDRGEARVG